MRERATAYLRKKIKMQEVVRPIAKEKMIYMGNYKCHLNCLSYAVKHESKVKSICATMQLFTDNDVVAHFVIELKDGTFIDPTYGNLADMLYDGFVIVKRYENIMGFAPDIELINTKEYIYEMLPFYLKMFVKKEEF